MLREILKIDEWLGREDSNLRMTIPKTVALPLGDVPMYKLECIDFIPINSGSVNYNHYCKNKFISLLSQPLACGDNKS